MCRMNSVIGNNRGGKTCEEILGCDRKTYFEYIQNKFVGEMNLNRRNEIHIDHIHWAHFQNHVAEMTLASWDEET